MNTVSEKIKEIITNMTIDNGLIVNEAKSIRILTFDEEFIGYLNIILDYDSNLFDSVVYYENPSIGNIEITNELVQTMIVSILSECIKYRNRYNKYTYGYKFLNSLYDRVFEALNDINELI